MCQYCQSEGCIHGEEVGSERVSRCSCGVTIGISSCPGCGCTCEPWWKGLNFSAKGSDLLQGPLGDLISDNADGNPSFFPISKSKILESLSEAYGLDVSSSQGKWLKDNLPEQMYKDTNHILYALISKIDPISRDQQKSGELNWKYPSSKVVLGQKLEIAQGDRVVMMSSGGRGACDVFQAGNYILSKENLGHLSSKSRSLAEGLEGIEVLDGFPLFLSPSAEFEVELSVMGQTKALRRIAARGIARLRISDPKLFAELLNAKGKYGSEATVSLLKKRYEDILKKEMSSHEFDEMKGNGALFENAIVQDAKSTGLECMKVSFSWVGEAGPGMFGSSAVPTMLDPARIAEMKQFAESMKAARMAGMRPTPTTMQSTSQPSANKTNTCISCGSGNPEGNKFCNNCGKPLTLQKKTCPKCGTQLDQGIRFCGNCGAKL